MSGFANRPTVSWPKSSRPHAHWIVPARKTDAHLQSSGAASCTPGDIGKADVLERLAAIAPVQARQGNNDAALAEPGLPLLPDLEISGRSVQVVHQLPDARPREGTDVVVYCHSCIPRTEWRAGVLFVNPGAAGRAGFHKVQTVVLLESGGGIHVRLVELGPRLKTKAEKQPRRPS